MKLCFLLFACLGALSLSAQKQSYKSAIVAFYNLENFYDTTDNPTVNDNDFLPTGSRYYTGEIYKEKVEHLAKVILQIGTDINADGPALLGVAEVENDTVLHNLIQQPSLINRHYQVVHYDSRDARGVDVALLYNPKYFKVFYSRKLFVKLPSGAKTTLFTRDILWVKGLLDGDTVHILVNHWPSRLGGEEKSAPGRFAAASVNRMIVDSLAVYEPNAKVIVMGDLNDDPVSASVTEVLKAKGLQSDLQKGDLYNPWVAQYKRGNGTLAYQDAWGLFDQIILSANWLPQKQTGYFLYQSQVFRQDYMIEKMGRYKGYPIRTWDGENYHGGFSDHFPTYLVLLKKAL